MLALSDEMRDRAVVAKERVVRLMTTLGTEAGRGSDCSEHFRLRDLQSTASIAFLYGLRTDLPDRSPIYDNDLLSFALRVPTKWKKEGQLVRTALKLANPQLARIVDANTGLPAGLCPPWSTVLGQAKDAARKAAARAADFSRAIARFREPPVGQTIFRSDSWHDMNGMLRLCERYRSLVERTVAQLDETLFNRDVVTELLRDDLAVRTPRLNKLWEMILTFGLFDAKWGPMSPRSKADLRGIQQRRAG